MIWTIKHTLEIIETHLVAFPNSSEFEFFLKLKAELALKLQQLEKTCGVCEKPCDNPECFAKDNNDKD